MFFLVDSSSSIWRPEFRQQLTFLRRLLPLFDLGSHHTRLGLAVYSRHVHPLLPLARGHSPHAVLRALDKAPYLTGTAVDRCRQV